MRQSHPADYARDWSQYQTELERVRGSLPSPATPDNGFGEASYRVYYRIQTHSGKSYIIMKLPAGMQSASEEITNYQGPKARPIPAWGEAPGYEYNTKPRAEGPTHASTDFRLATLVAEKSRLGR